MAAPQVLFYQQLGRALSEARRSRKISQEALAAVCGLSRASIVNIERGRQPLSALTLVHWCSAVNVRVEEVLPPLVGSPSDDIEQQLADLKPQSREWVKRVAALDPEKAAES